MDDVKDIILSYLPFKDLVSLSKSSKKITEFLTGPSSRNFWRGRIAKESPDYPKDDNIPPLLLYHFFHQIQSMSLDKKIGYQALSEIAPYYSDEKLILLYDYIKGLPHIFVDGHAGVLGNFLKVSFPLFIHALSDSDPSYASRKYAVGVAVQIGNLDIIHYMVENVYNNIGTMGHFIGWVTTYTGQTYIKKYCLSDKLRMWVLEYIGFNDVCDFNLDFIKCLLPPGTYDKIKSERWFKNFRTKLLKWAYDHGEIDYVYTHILPEPTFQDILDLIPQINQKHK
jgi:hypothetical protein